MLSVKPYIFCSNVSEIDGSEQVVRSVDLVRCQFLAGYMYIISFVHSVNVGTCNNNFVGFVMRLRCTADLKP